MSSFRNMGSHVIDERKEMLERTSMTTAGLPLTHVRWILCSMSSTGMIVKLKQSIEDLVATVPVTFVLSGKL